MKCYTFISYIVYIINEGIYNYNLYYICILCIDYINILLNFIYICIY